MNQLFASGGQSIAASATVLPMNIQGFLHYIEVIYVSVFLSPLYLKSLEKRCYALKAKEQRSHTQNRCPVTSFNNRMSTFGRIINNNLSMFIELRIMSASWWEEEREKLSSLEMNILVFLVGK